MFTPVLVKKFQPLKTPFYYYDADLLRDTLNLAAKEAKKRNYILHYAVKANANKKILEIINQFGLSADCVSGNEILRAAESGFDPNSIAFAGVGKTDEEILIGLKHDIFSFNVESLQELEVINSIAKKINKTVKVALRINPNVDARTHRYITTGLESNKFGINKNDLSLLFDQLKSYTNIKITGLHFHIGSQISDPDVFKGLCIRINEFQNWFNDKGIEFEHINAGGGLGVDYENPDENSIPDFDSYFSIFEKFLELRPNQQLHLEPGRAITAQCGSLISRVLFIKQVEETKFVILDAGMTELIRPALYQSYHKIENLTSTGNKQKYDVVGPICETSDTFGKAVLINKPERGDLIAIRSAGAYGEVMSSGYNLRSPVKSYFSDDL